MYIHLLYLSPIGRNKLVRDKTTWAERKLTSRRLGLVLPKHTGKTFQEKRKLSEAEKKVIDGKVKRLKKGDEEVKEDGAEVNGKDEDDVEEVKDESMQEETEEKKSIMYPLFNYCCQFFYISLCLSFIFCFFKYICSFD